MPAHSNVDHRSTASTTPAIVSTGNSFEQFDNAKNTPPHGRETPISYQPPEEEEEEHVETPAASGSSEFSGLVSYFSSQQDDLET